MRGLHNAVVQLCSVHEVVCTNDQWMEIVEGFDEFLDALIDTPKLLIADVYCPLCHEEVESRATA